MSTPRTSNVLAVTHGHCNYDKPEVYLILRGPRGGTVGSGGLSPDAARNLAVALNRSADEVDPPK